ncbi:CysB family HTH-type transcriptional regulator [Cupriavidus sp. AU9028]|uniref:CysB family HTH-type transcriptional regulator n=1 Tax=Cupriavidus sp. AU9028 TaxID=2871157 RepID=UPI001C96639A|nr:CysB family HTH-type transcriptional regulator [Cupriavidus sp. AU9028]MBY4898035.1 CysB family HTH-type transcriptional regulator [Cupriavidus sp. AU9028]
MNFQQLRSIREAVRRQFNLTEVANALYTSQPGVSRQIRELEEELGVEIFERYGKRLTGLTPPGREIVRIVERLLLEAENLKQAGDEFAGRHTGRLTVATTHTQARYALPRVVTAFRRSYPHVTLALQEASPAHIVELLLSGQADIGIATEALASEPALTAFDAYSWQHVLVVAPQHPLTLVPQPTLEDVAGFPLITYDAGFTGRRRIDAAFADAGLHPEIVLTALDADVIKTYAELDLGVGIIASMAYDERKDSGLVRIDAGHLFQSNTTSVAVRRGAYLRGYAQSFIQLFAPHLSPQAVSSVLSEANGAVALAD